jgi:hypothetical protein
MRASVLIQKNLPLESQGFLGIPGRKYVPELLNHYTSLIHVLLSSSGSGIRFFSPLRSTASPFEWVSALAGHCPGYASTMGWSDCHAAIPPPRLFGLLEASSGERHGSPKFRCKPLNDLPWTQTPARRAALALTHVTLLASGP